MTQDVKFETQDGAVLIEADVLPDTSDDEGPTRAGLRDRIRGQSVVEAKATLNEALSHTLAANARALNSSTEEMDPQPDEVELMFGLKATGELGNIAIAKVSAEASMSVRILWRRSASSSNT